MSAPSENTLLRSLLSFLRPIATGLIVGGIFFVAARLPGNFSMHLGLSLIWLGIFLAMYVLSIEYPIPSTRQRKYLVIFLVLAVLTIFGIPPLIDALANQSIKSQTQALPTTPHTSTKRIFLYERYGGEWHTSNREPIVFVNNNAFLRSHFVKGKTYRFTPMIRNAHETVALATGVGLFIELPKTLTVQPPTLWRITDSEGDVVDYYAEMAEIPPGASMGINESLFITFPSPGRYRVRYVIQGRATTGEGFEQIARTFYFELTE